MIVDCCCTHQKKAAQMMEQELKQNRRCQRKN